MNYFLEDDQTISRHLPTKDFAAGHHLLKSGTIVIKNLRFSFRSQWNCGRHFLGLMAAFNPSTRLSDRQN